MEEIDNGLRRLWETVFAWVPKLIGAIVILILAYIVAKVVSKLVHMALQKAGLDKLLHSGHGGNILQRAIPSPASFIGTIVFWLIWLWGLSVTVSVLGIPALNQLVSGIYNYLPNVFAALLIFLVAGAVSAAVSTLVNRTLGDTPSGKIASSVFPIIIMGIAVFMILDQLKIAPTIVTITYAAMMFGLFLGLALSFGLGGRDVASKMLESAYESGKKSRAQLKQDLKLGKARMGSAADEVAVEGLKRAAR